MKNLNEVNEYLRKRGLLNEEKTEKQENLKLDTLEGVKESLRRRGSLNEEETKKQANPSKEVQIRFIKKVETDKTENKKTEPKEE